MPLTQPAQNRLRRVQIFLAGQRRGKPYTIADLDDMCANFRHFSVGVQPLLRVPAVLGHDEQQDLLRQSNLPAAAWCSDLYHEGPRLYADFEDMPKSVACLIRGKRYRQVSAEIYDSPPEGIPGRGKMLRRVAFLGGEIPQVKGLADIPMPEPYSESAFAARPPLLFQWRAERHDPRVPGLWQVFSEVQAMDRQAMLEALAKKGVQCGAISDVVPDPVLAEWLRSLDGAGQVQQEPSRAPSRAPASAPDEFADWQEPQGEEQMGAYKERAKKLKAFSDKMCAKYGDCEGGAVSDVSGGSMGAGKKKPEEEMPMKMSEVQALVATAVKEALAADKGGTIGELQKFREDVLAGEKSRAVDAFIDRMGRSGKLAPSQVEATRKRLLRADSRRPVEKFSEGGKTVDLTELDLQMRELELLPTRFGEHFRDPATGGSNDPDAEARKVEQHFDSFSESFKGLTTKTGLVEGYKAARKADPTLTADGFLGL